ncbi:MAG: 1,4-alpha-glucan branching protein domain-containing protein [Nitrospirota bacterium]
MTAASSSGTFLFVLHAHMPYVLNHGRDPHGSQWLCEAAAHSYLPLLGVLWRLAAEGISPRLTVGLSPVLCEQLASAQFHKELAAFLETRLLTCQQNRSEFRAQGQREREPLVDFWEAFYQERWTQFGRYGGDLLAQFQGLEEEGHLELITCGATHGYLPLLSRDETVALQLDQAMATHRRHFGRTPRGIWLPECAYRPRYEWSPPVRGSGAGERGRLRAVRPGLEEHLAARGLNYFFADTHMVTGGASHSYYHELYPVLERLHTGDEHEILRRQECTPYDSYWVASPGGTGRAAVFARDQRLSVQVWSRELGYPGDGAYLDFHKQHLPGGLKYWRVTHPKAPLEEKETYDPREAQAQTRIHAEQFCDLVAGILRRQQERRGAQGPPILCASYDMELYGHWWFEGPQWVYHMSKALHRAGVTVRSCSEQLSMQPPHRTITLLEGSWGEGGDHRVWLNKDTEWIWERLYEVETEAWALRDAVAALSPEGNGARRALDRLVAQAFRSFLLLCASDWQFQITTQSARDYAEMRFARHYSEFKRLAQLARDVMAGDQLTAEDEGFLARKEAQDFLFPALALPGCSPGASGDAKPSLAGV